MITLDTSGLLAVLRPTDRHHSACRAVIEHDSGPYFIPVAALAEITYVLEATLPAAALQVFLEDLRVGSFTPAWDVDDIPRVQELTRRYHDLPLGFADAAVIACAERRSGRVLTLDKRHFPVVARGEKSITVLPE